MANDLVPRGNPPARIEDEKPWRRAGTTGPACQLFCDVETIGERYGGVTNLGLWVFMGGLYHPVNNIWTREVTQEIQRRRDIWGIDGPPSHFLPEPEQVTITIRGDLIEPRWEV